MVLGVLGCREDRHLNAELTSPYVHVAIVEPLLPARRDWEKEQYSQYNDVTEDMRAPGSMQLH